MIIDGHFRIFPPFDSAGGFDSVERKMKFVQRQSGGHHLPIWRVRDRTPADRSTLLDPETYELNDVEWSSETGRLSWIHDGEAYTNQYLPPMLDNQECTPELLIREMDYIGVDMGVLHPAPIFGIVNDYNLDAVQRFPDRFIALFNIPEATVLNDQTAAIAKIERLVGSGVKSGVQFFSRWYHGTGIDEPWDGESMTPYWDAVTALDVPVYFTLYNGGKRAREFQASQRET
jgi:predicted TIM-barrel fold metal-dependent hydrolase